MVWYNADMTLFYYNFVELRNFINAILLIQVTSYTDAEILNRSKAK